jgi:hypothetical protein
LWRTHSAQPRRSNRPRKTAYSEMSTQIIPLKDRTDLRGPSEFQPQRLFAFELRRWERSSSLVPGSRQKARAPYEFGCKVSIATPVTAPKGRQFVLHAKAGRPRSTHGEMKQPRRGSTVLLNTPSVAARPIAPARGLSTSASLFYSLASCCRVRVGREARGGGGLGQRATAMTVTAKNFTGGFSGEFMPPFKPKPRQPSMSKAELRAQGVLALAQASKPVMKLPMKIKRQCARCDHFNSLLVEPGEAVPAFKCLACGYSMARP